MNIPKDEPGSGSDAQELEPSETHREGVLHAARARVRSSWDWFRWRLHWASPSLFPSPYERDENYQRLRDDLENKETKVPLGTNLRVRVVWGVEYYGSAEIEGLYAALEKLRWRGVGGHNENWVPLRWLSHQRAYGSAGAWLNVGTVLNKGQKRNPTIGENFAKLPEGVNSLQVGIFQLTPSLSAVVVGFHLEDRLAARYEEILNSDRATQLQRGPRFSIRHANPAHLKREDVEKTRAELRRLVGGWFAGNLPGYFSRLGRLDAVPTMELLTANGLGDTTSARAYREDWSSLLVQVSPHNTWLCSETGAIEISIEDYFGDVEHFHIVAQVDLKRMPSDKLRMYGGVEYGIGRYCHDLFDGMLARAAVLGLLKEQGRDLRITRERIRNVRLRRRRISQTLRDIGQFFERTVGASIAARDLAEQSKSSGQFVRDFPKFELGESGFNGGGHNFAKAVRIAVNRIASRLARDEIEIREYFNQVSAVLSIQESVRVQRRILLLTIAAVLIASVSLAVTAMGPDYFFTSWNSLLGRLKLNP